MITAKQKYAWAFEKDPKVEKTACLTIQELVNEANFWLTIHSCILYGLMEGELPNAERCLHYLELGERFGVKPDKDYISPGFVTAPTNKAQVPAKH